MVSPKDLEIEELQHEIKRLLSDLNLIASLYDPQRDRSYDMAAVARAARRESPNDRPG